MSFKKSFSRFFSSSNDEVEVSESNGVRYLHLGSDTVQSAMRIASPNELVLSYTKTMMAFLLFQDENSRMSIIGLGGGSLVKFIYHNMPNSKITVVEKNRKIIGVAHQLFNVPANDTRLEVVECSGEDWVKKNTQIFDVLLVDGYDGYSQVSSLTTNDFYRSTRGVLSDDGMIVLNFWAKDPSYDLCLRRIRNVYETVFCIPAARKGNIIVFGMCKSMEKFNKRKILQIAARLDRRYQLGFVGMAEAMSSAVANTSQIK